jgi:predicted lipoprotein with Yx(FWY)xxD motif
MNRSMFSRLALAGALTLITLAAPVAASAAPAAAPAQVKVARTPLGNVLVGPNNLTLYMFTRDADGQSVCYDQCARNWPPLLTDGAPVAGRGVDAAKLGTTTRKDGATQVTYNGMPLYYWFQDKKAGDVRGQNVGTVWFVVAPDGSVNKQIAARVAVAKSPLGDILVGPTGLTLYMFNNDTRNTSNCYEQCAVNWPPLLTDVAPIADTGVTRRLLGTTKRTDGKLQVTYNGMPLYYWKNDKAAGDVLGQSVGQVWWVVAPNGKAVNKPAPVAAAVSIANTNLGNILVGPDGRTLYMFTQDADGVSACYDECAVAWPPLLTNMKPAAGNGADPALLGTTTRKDGALQVTYNGMPLYYWAADQKPGDTTGQNVGGVWFVLDVAGKIIK